MVVKNDICHSESGFTPLRVIDCIVLDDTHLRVEFNDGSVKDVNCGSLLSLPAFKPLADPEVFKEFAIDHGVVTWLGGEIDIAPEWLFDHGENYTYPSDCIVETSVAEEQATYGRK